MDGRRGAMRSNFIERIINEQTGDKIWTHVYFDNGTVWIPALWEQGFIAQQVVRCERMKYKNLPWDAADKTSDFIRKAAYGQNIEGPCYEYDLTKQGSFERLPEVVRKSRQQTELWDLSDDKVC